MSSYFWRYHILTKHVNVKQQDDNVIVLFSDRLVFNFLFFPRLFTCVLFDDENTETRPMLLTKGVGSRTNSPERVLGSPS